ncbi:MAG: hypothetical protein A2079_03590 [Geobacteraceae bacterium GWC2_48_7]|nr:MAG: hypothetical protein A2079_03590 [Geobacteraceae bacterium GWC2_48_7]
MTDILMPKLSDTMTEGVLGSWKKNVGEKIARGDIIAEIETDKAVMELEAFASGTLLEQKVKSGATVQVGTVIGVIGEKGEAVEQPQKQDQELHEQREEPEKKEQYEQPEQRENPVEHADSSDYPQEKNIRQTGKSAPVVRRQAHELGVEIDDVKGSGPGGRILMEDVERYAAGAERIQKSGVPEKQMADADVPKGEKTTAGVEIIPLNRMRKAVAHTVSNSWSTIPHFAVSIKIQVDKILELKQELKKNDLPVTLNDIMIKGSALCLEKFPLINASLSGENILVHRDINIGIMVSVTDGLLVPVIKGCRYLSIGKIAEASADLAERARNGKITEQNLTEGTFSISNLGMFGITRFFAVILPGQAAILAVGGIMDEYIAVDGKTVSSKAIEVTLSADHRILDGAYAARFLVELKQVLENPVRLLTS